MPPFHIRLTRPLRRVPALRRVVRFVRTVRQAVRIRVAARRARRAPDDFDRTSRVRTRVATSLGDLVRIARRGGFDHEPTPPNEFRAIIAGLDVHIKKTVFVDYGSGAGRAVLLASEFPFRGVIGIELSADLHARAQANLAAFDRTSRGLAPVRLVCADATTWEPPLEPLVLYFYNPFGVAVMRSVLAKIEASLARAPRPITLVAFYCEKDPRAALEASPRFRVTSSGRDVAVLQAVLDTAVRPAPGRSRA